MQPTAAAHQHHQNHNHQISVNFPEYAPPTLTPRKRGCGCTLGIVALALASSFVIRF